MPDHEDSEGLGNIPHQIRGFLGSFSTQIIMGQKYEKCTACSPAVLNAYKDKGLDFLVSALANPEFLEDLTGLSTLHSQADQVDGDWDDSDE